MNRLTWKWMLAAGLLALLMSGCERQEGPMEEAGRNIDETMEKAGDKAEEAMEDAGDAIEDATDPNKP
jgi:hypothetical protein